MSARHTAALTISALILGTFLAGTESASAAEGKGRLKADAMRGRSLDAVAAHAYRHGVEFDLVKLSISARGKYHKSPFEKLYLRYANIVGFGQIDPEAAQIPWDIKRPNFSSEAAMLALRTRGLHSALASLPPPSPGYTRLVDALARYRKIGSEGGWPTVPSGGLLKIDSRGYRVSLLRQRLASEGIISGSEHRSRVFGERLRAAVIDFQRRHGLKPDGIVGPKTLTALNVPVRQRVDQIIANLERWRWLPRNLNFSRIEVNIASATLSIFEGDQEVLRMRVVVGSPKHPTPILRTEIRKVVLNPPWNVPDSIWRKELFPRLRRNPDYLATRNMQIIGRADDPYGRQIDWKSLKTPPKGIRIQQKPGPKNALGRVKFHAPNRFDVYLHDTPGRTAFQKSERALSHGCIRLERPDALLGFLFRSGAPMPQLAQIGDQGPRETGTVPAPKPLPVFLLYWTAFVTPDGIAHFRKDLYGHDARMAAAISGPNRKRQRILVASGCGWKQKRS